MVIYFSAQRIKLLSETFSYTLDFDSLLKLEVSDPKPNFRCISIIIIIIIASEFKVKLVTGLNLLTSLELQVLVFQNL